MEINIPKTATVSHELPIFNELAKDSKLPVSEVKARFHSKMLELHQKALDDPAMLSLGGDNDELVHMAVNELRQELQHPEETTSDDDEYDRLMGFDPNEPVPGSDIFDQAAGGDAFGGMGGDMGGGMGGGMGGFGGDMGGAGGGIDNLDLGFSDEGMASLDEVPDANGEIPEDAGDVNALSELEPSSDENIEEGDETPPPADTIEDNPTA